MRDLDHATAATRRRYRSIARLQQDNARCRRCLDAGHRIELPPVFSGRAGQRAYLFGLAPGRM